MDTSTDGHINRWTHQQMDTSTDGHTNRWTHQQMDTSTDGPPTDGHTNRWTHQQMDTPTDGHTNRWTHQQMDTSTDGHINRWTHQQMDNQQMDTSTDGHINSDNQAPQNDAHTVDEPLCWAKRLAVEGILSHCDLHHTNIALHCNFCVLENGRMTEDPSGKLTYNRTIPPEICEFAYFPKRTGIYRFEVRITGNYSLLTNEVIISELPELHLQQPCRYGSRVICTGRWFGEVPFIKMSSDGIELDEMTINRYPVTGVNDTYFSVAKAQLSKPAPTRVTCHAMYKVRSVTEIKSQDLALQTYAAESASRISFTNESGVYLPEKITISPGMILHLQCSSESQPINLSLSCANAHGDVLSTYGESPIRFDIHATENFADVQCKCMSHTLHGCYSEKEILIANAVEPKGKWSAAVPVFKTNDGFILGSRYEMRERTNSTVECSLNINEVIEYNVTVTCRSYGGLLLLNLSHNSHPVKFLVTGDNSFNMSSCKCQISFSDLISQFTIFVSSIKSNRSGHHLSGETTTPQPPNRYDAYSPAYYILTGVITFFFFPFHRGHHRVRLPVLAGDAARLHGQQPLRADAQQRVRIHQAQPAVVQRGIDTGRELRPAGKRVRARTIPYWNSDSGGSSRSNPYFTDTPPGY
ncbi:hypothetical protein Btru_073546 [Bulinus truncatus]|nr:hypothetical protein Btru_073546 [Bulinus truncatus]